MTSTMCCPTWWCILSSHCLHNILFSLAALHLFSFSVLHGPSSTSFLFPFCMVWQSILQCSPSDSMISISLLKHCQVCAVRGWTASLFWSTLSFALSMRWLINQVLLSSGYILNVMTSTITMMYPFQSHGTAPQSHSFLARPLFFFPFRRARSAIRSFLFPSILGDE